MSSGASAARASPIESFELLWVLAFAMGLQNASIANATGSLVRTTHMTGPATDLGVALAFLILRDTPENVRRAARQTLALRASKIVGFTVGAAAAAFAAPYLGFLGFLVPAATCGAIAVRVFASRTRLDGLAGREALTDG